MRIDSGAGESPAAGLEGCALMAADYEAGPALSSIAALCAGDFALQQIDGEAISTGSRKNARFQLQTLEPISRISHLHITLVHCTRVSNSNRMPGNGIDVPRTLSQKPEFSPCASLSP